MINTFKRRLHACIPNFLYKITVSNILWSRDVQTIVGDVLHIKQQFDGFKCLNVVITRLLMCYSTINVFYFVKNDLIHFERIYLYPTDIIMVSCTATVQT